MMIKQWEEDSSYQVTIEEREKGGWSQGSETYQTCTLNLVDKTAKNVPTFKFNRPI